VDSHNVRRIHVVSYRDSGLTKSEVVKKADQVVLGRENFERHNDKLSSLPKHFKSVGPDQSRSEAQEFAGKSVFTAPVVDSNGRSGWELFEASLKRGIERAGRIYLRTQENTEVESILEKEAKLFDTARTGHMRLLFMLEAKLEEQIVELTFTLNTNPALLESQAHGYGRYLLRKVGLGAAVTIGLKIYGEHE